MITNIRKSLFLLAPTLVVALSWLPGFAQKPSIGNDRPFEPSEELTYKAEFSRSLLRKLDVANFKFTVARVAKSGKPDAVASDNAAYTLKLTGDVESQGFFARLFGINFHQRVESTVEPDLFVVQKTTRLDEQGKRIRQSEAIFDYARGQVTWVERDPGDPARPQRVVTTKFEGPIQDILSTIYFLRMRKLELGRSFDVPISDSGRIYQVSMAVVERKRMKTPLGRVFVIRIDPQLFGPQGMIAEDGRFSIWLTDDNRRIPVSARLKTRYGTFDITLKKALHSPSVEVFTADRD